MEMKSFCVVGAGAIGGLVGARLSELQDAQVTLVARGEHLEAMKGAGGLVVVDPKGEEKLYSKVKLAGSLGEIEETFDVVLLAVKSHQLVPIAKDVERVCNEKTVVVTLQNGLPWWYFYKSGSQYEGHKFKTMDPAGDLDSIRLDRIIGCIAFPGAEITKPGVVHHIDGDMFPLGEPDCSKSERAVAFSEAMQRAGFRAPIRDDFREEVWIKLIGNVCFNPISALTGAVLSEIATNSWTKQLCADCMGEAIQVAEAVGAKVPISIERRIEGARRVGSHKTSMLQDVIKAKPVETDILSSVIELAELVGVKTPSIRALYAVLELLNEKIKEKQGSRI